MSNAIKYISNLKRDYEPSDAEKELTMLLTRYKYSAEVDAMFTILFKDGTCYDTWYLFFDDNCVFRVQESGDGYIIMYSAPDISDKVVAYLKRLLYR